LAVMLIDGGECVSDLGALAAQPDLFGRVASHSTASRVLHAIGVDERVAIGAARAAARERAWRLGGRPERIVLDFDSHLVEVHSEKEGAAPNRKHGFGFHPLGCWLDETGEALAMLLRPGNAGANTAADHVTVLDTALAQLPADVADRERDEPVAILARADAAGATHAFAAALRQRRIRFSLGYYVTETVGQAALALGQDAWQPALDADGRPRDGAWVAELTDHIDLSAWPAHTRLIVRRERPHPGAQLRFTDVDGHRYQAFLTDQRGEDLAALEVCHRLHARVEDRIAEGRELGLARLPFRAFDANQTWLEIILLAQDLLAHTRALILDSDSARLAPKRLRHRLLHVAGRLTRSGRRRTLHLPAAWPWANALIAAFTRLRALPAPG
ncbi:MAG TPA: IS1380 family transposase, partial [Solirubrobacteraceae bacterium]|nr:IS1380 family transposase [Solirubrobacteraceae bacterium]